MSFETAVKNYERIQQLTRDYDNAVLQPRMDLHPELNNLSWELYRSPRPSIDELKTDTERVQRARKIVEMGISQRFRLAPELILEWLLGSKGKPFWLKIDRYEHFVRLIVLIKLTEDQVTDTREHFLAEITPLITHIMQTLSLVHTEQIDELALEILHPEGGRRYNPATLRGHNNGRWSAWAPYPPFEFVTFSDLTEAAEAAARTTWHQMSPDN